MTAPDPFQPPSHEPPAGRIRPPMVPTETALLLVHQLAGGFLLGKVSFLTYGLLEGKTLLAGPTLGAFVWGWFLERRWPGEDPGRPIAGMAVVLGVLACGVAALSDSPCSMTFLGVLVIVTSAGGAGLGYAMRLVVG